VKTYYVSVGYTDRRIGPGVHSRGDRVEAGTPHLAIYRYLRSVWEKANRKQRNDMRRGGLKIECREVGA
jgi:hypothetical protein